MPRLETDIENECVDIAAAVDMESAKLDKLKRSWPDRVFFIPPPAFCWFVEFKRPGETPRPQQSRRLSRFASLGFPVDVVADVATFRTLLARRVKGR